MSTIPSQSSQWQGPRSLLSFGSGAQIFLSPPRHPGQRPAVRSVVPSVAGSVASGTQAGTITGTMGTTGAQNANANADGGVPIFLPPFIGPKLVPTTPILKYAMREVIKECEIVYEEEESFRSSIPKHARGHNQNRSAGTGRSTLGTFASFSDVEESGTVSFLASSCAFTAFPHSSSHCHVFL